MDLHVTYSNPLTTCFWQLNVWCSIFYIYIYYIFFHANYKADIESQFLLYMDWALGSLGWHLTFLEFEDVWKQLQAEPWKPPVGTLRG